MNPNRILATGIATLIFATAAVRAQTWDGAGAAGGSLLWSTAANWNPDAAPVNNGTANVIFGGAIDLTPDMDANWSINSLTFNNTAGAFVLSSTGGFTLSIGAGGITNNDNNGQTINNAITLGAAQTWNSAGNLISVSGAVNNGGNLLTLAGVGAALSGPISGSGGLTVNSGAVTLSGASANTYSGVTQVNGGILLLQKTAGVNALGGTLVIGDGAGTDEVRLGANNQIGIATPVTVASGGLFNLFGFSDGFLQLVVNGGSTTIGAGTLTLGTSLTMTGGSVSSTSGALVLQGLLNTNAAATSATISGNLDLSAVTRNFTVADGAATEDLDISATISNGGISKLGQGTLRLGAANNFAGGLSVGAGTVTLGTNTSAGTGTLTLSGGTIASDAGLVTLANAVSLVSNSTANNITFSGTTTLVGSRALTVASGTTTFAGGIVGDVTSNAFTKDGAGTLVMAGATANTYVGTTTVIAGTLTLAKNPSIVSILGNLTISNAQVNVNANEQIANTSTVNVQSNSDFVLGGGVFEQIASLNISNFADVTIGTGTLTVSNVQVTGIGTLTSSGGGVLQLNGNFATLSTGASQTVIGASMNFGGVARTFTIDDGSQVFDAVISNITNGPLIKNGPGGLLLSTGIFPFGLTVNEGVIGAENGSSLGTGTVTLNGGEVRGNVQGVSFPNAVTINGDVGFGGTASMTFTGSVVLGAAAPTLTFSNSGLTTFSGAIGQSAPGSGFTKAGTGIVTFSGAAPNTFNGTTNVFGGTLILNKASGVSAIGGDLVIGDGVGSDIVQVVQNDQIANSAGVTVNNGSTLDLVGVSDSIRALSAELNSTVGVSGGVLTVGIDGLQISGGNIGGVNGTLMLAGEVTSPASNVGIGTISTALNLGGVGRVFNVQNGAASLELAISGVVSNGNINKSGDGVLRLSGTAANTFTNLTVGAGTVELGKTAGINALGGDLFVGDGVGGASADVVRLLASDQIPHLGGRTITVNNSGLLNLNGFSETVGNLVLDGGSVTTGAGTLTLGSTAQISTIGSTATAFIGGNVNLGGLTRDIIVASGGLSVDLDITAAIGGGGIAKNGLGRLRLSGTNTYSGGLLVNGGTVLLASNTAQGTGLVDLGGGALEAAITARTLTNPFSVSQGGTIQGSQDITLNGTISIAESSSLTKDGTGTLTFGPGTTVINGSITLNAGTLTFAVPKTIGPLGAFTQQAGTFNGTLINRGTFTYNGGVFNGSLQNEGGFFINSDFLAAGGFTNLGSITISAGPNFGANGTGLDNEGTITLNGGRLQSNASGAFVNNGAISGFGAIEGTGGFTNNAQITVVGGNLTLAALNAANAGNIEVSVGRQLRLLQALGNSGTVALAGGTLSGTALLNNGAGGTLSGRGAVTAPLVNSGGTIRAEGGTLNVTSAFNSSGIIRVIDGAGFAGGTITNTGRIQGDGSVANAIVNNGRIEAQGTLALGGVVTQNAAGTIAASAGNTVLFTTGLATNAGTVSLTGGTFDNNGVAMNNTGQISGFGTISTGALTNNGGVTLTGGFSTVNGNVTNAAGKQFKVAHDAALFTGNFVNNGTFKNTDGTVTFAGTYTENGTFVSDPADNFFMDLLIGGNGALVGGLGDRFIVGGSLLGASTQTSLWETSAAELRFSGGLSHTFTVGASDEGANFFGYNENFSWGELSLAVGELLFLDEGLVPGGVVYVGKLDLAGGLAQVGAVTGPGTIYYDPYDDANDYLGGGTYALTGGGTITPIAVDLRIVSTSRNAGGHIVLTCVGAPERLNRIEAVSSLTPAPTAWATIATMPAAEDGTFTFTDTNAPSFPTRFYRIAYP